jgi:hypothetical protein
MALSPPSLPSNRAFVVQFRSPPAGEPARYDGRVEHLVSGQVARFHSLEELLAFMIRMLSDVAAPSECPVSSPGAATALGQRRAGDAGSDGTLSRPGLR